MRKVGDFKLTCVAENAMRFRSWIDCRGGVAVWNSCNLSNPGQSWSTPAQALDGTPTTKPHYYAGVKPDFVVTEEKDVGVITERVVKRFHVAVRRGSSNPFLFKCTDASSRRIRKEVEKAGDGAYHTFDYSTQDAIILAPASIVPLSEWHPDGAPTS